MKNIICSREWTGIGSGMDRVWSRIHSFFHRLTPDSILCRFCLASLIWMIMGTVNVWGDDYIIENADYGQINPTYEGQVIATTAQFENTTGITQISYTYNAFNGDGDQVFQVEYSLDGTNYTVWNTKPEANNGVVNDVIPTNHPARNAVRFRFVAIGAPGQYGLWGFYVRKTNPIVTLNGKDKLEETISEGVKFYISGRSDKYSDYGYTSSPNSMNLQWTVPNAYILSVKGVKINCREEEYWGNQNKSYYSSTRKASETRVNSEDKWTDLSLDASYFPLGKDSSVSFRADTRQFQYKNVVITYALAANSFDVTLDNERPTSAGSSSVTLTYDLNTHAAITNPTKSGYTFDGWYSGYNGTGDLVIATDGTLRANVSGYTGDGGKWVKTTATTLYAKWTANEYTITLNNQSATTAGTESITATFDANTNLTGTPAITKPTKTSKVFGGYYTDVNGNGIQIIDEYGNVIAGVSGYTDASKNWKYAGNITLYANWVSQHNPSFSFTGGKTDLKVGEVLSDAYEFEYVIDSAASYRVISIDPINEGSGKVIEYDKKTNSITAINAGVAKIVIDESGNDTILAGHSDTTTITVTKNANALSCSWEGWSKNVGFESVTGVTFSATNTRVGAPTISVTPASGTANATYANNEITASYNVGSATWTVSQAEDYKYVAANETLTVNVGTETSPGTKIILYNNNNTTSDITCSQFGTNGEAEILAPAGYASQLFFEAKKTDNKTRQIYAQEYVNGSWGTQWKVEGSLEENKYKNPADYLTYFRKDMSSNATKIKFWEGSDNTIRMRHVYVTGNPYGVRLTNASRAAISSITLPKNYKGGHETRGKFYVDFGTCANTIKLVSSNARLTFAASESTTHSFSTGSDHHGLQEIELVYTSPADAEADINATITVYTPYENETLTVHAVTLDKLTTTLEYLGADAYSVTNNDIEATTLFQVRDVNGDLVASPTITLSSSDDEVIDAATDNTKIDFVCGGSARITASYAGDTKYAACNLAQDIAVNLLEDAITWDADADADGKFHVYADSYISNTIASAHTTISTYESGDDDYLTATQSAGVWTLHAEQIGEVTLTATSAGSCTYDVAEDTKTIVIDPCYQSIKWDQTFMGLTTAEDGTISQRILLTAKAVDAYDNETERGITYSLESTEFARIENDNELVIFGMGTTILNASTTDEDTKYEQATASRGIKVRAYGTGCGSEVVDESQHKVSGYTNTSGITYPIPPSDKLYVKVGRQSSITCDSLQIIAYDANDVATLIARYNPSALTDAGEDKEFDLDEKYRKIKFIARGETGIDPGPNGGTQYKWFSNLRVTQKSYLRTDVDAISGSVTVGNEFSRSFTISYSDKPLLNYSYSGEFLTLTSDKTVNNDCGDYGTYTFTLSGVMHKAGSISESISITTSAGDELEIPVTITVSAGDEVEFTGDNDTWNKTDATTSITPVTISRSVTITEHVEAYSVTIADGKNLVIAPTGGLTVYAGGINGDGKNNITLQADDDIKNASFAQTGYLRVSPDWGGTMPNATVELYSVAYTSASEAKWQYVGVPVTGIGGWDVCTYGKQYIYGWDEPTSAWSDAYGEALTPFEGYCLTQTNSEGGRKFTFNGTLVAPGTKNISLSYTPSAPVVANRGCHVLANSFAAPIDISLLESTDFGGATGTIYMFNTGSQNDVTEHPEVSTGSSSTAGQYIAVTPGTATGIYEKDDKFPIVIPPMQGFYVQTSNNVTMKLDYRKLVWEADYDEHPNKPMRVVAKRAKKETDVTDFIKMTLTDGEAADILYLLASGSYNKKYENGYDAPKMMSDNPSLPNIFAVEDDGQLAIDATSDIESTFIGVRTGAASNYTLYFSHVDCETEWMLLDIQTNKTTRIADGASYSFSATPDQLITNRFLIVEWDGKEGTATGTDEITIQNKIQKFIYNGQMYILKDGVLYDARGMVVRR